LEKIIKGASPTYQLHAEKSKAVNQKAMGVTKQQGEDEYSAQAFIFCV
jgi:hypothetical protein